MGHRRTGLHEKRDQRYSLDGDAGSSGSETHEETSEEVNKMTVYSVTKDNPEGIDRFQLFTTKELADTMAKRWVDEDVEFHLQMEKESERYSDGDRIPDPYPYEWRWNNERDYWEYGQIGQKGGIYSIFVHEMEIHETLPQ